MPHNLFNYFHISIRNREVPTFFKQDLNSLEPPRDILYTSRGPGAFQNVRRPESITSRAWINFFKINNASIELEICAFFDLFIMDVGAIDGTCEQQYTFFFFDQQEEYLWESQRFFFFFT